MSSGQGLPSDAAGGWEWETVEKPEAPARDDAADTPDSPEASTDPDADPADTADSAGTDTGTGAGTDTGTDTSTARRGSLAPSPLIVLILGLAGLGGWMAWTRVEFGPFLLVVCAWMFSVALHEWAHTFLAHRFGARGLRGSGLITLNPLRYQDAFARFVLPVAALLLSNVGITGMAPRAGMETSEPLTRLRRSLVAAAGPVVNLVLAVGLIAAVRGFLGEAPTDSWFWSSLVFLAVVQFTAAVIALLPIPGLDGFAILAPWLPQRIQQRCGPGSANAANIGVFSVVGVFAVVWFPPVHTALLDGLFRLLEVVGINPLLLGLGQAAVTFWSS